MDDNSNKEKAYLKLIEDSPDGFLVLDDKGFGLFTNTKAKDLLQRDESEIIGKEIGLPIVLTDSTELEIPQKNGLSRTIELRVVETFWGNKNAYLCNLRDITEQKKAEEELKRHEAFLEKTGELARVGGWEVDPVKLEVYWSHTTKLLHEVPEDYKPDLDKAIDFFPGKSKESIKKAINNAIQEGESYDLVLEFITAKGNHRWVHTVGIPEMFRGKCVRLWGVFQDITEQHEIEIKLQKQAERFRVALSDSSIIVWQQDRDLRYKWIYNIHHNLDESDVIGKKDEELLSNSSEINQLKEVKERVIKTGKKETKEVKTTIKNKPYYYRLNVEPLKGDEEEIVGITCVSIDITQLKQAYKELEKAKEKAEESDRLKSAFLANISHEIRTPMNGIMGFANLLKKPDLEGDKQKEFIDIIQESGNRMVNIIDELIDIAKIESNQIEILKQETCVNDILDNQYHFFSEETREKGLELSFNKTFEDQDSMLFTDPNKLSQILTNLIKNAIKYTEEGTIEIGYTPEKDTFRFFVSDTGIGIDEEVKEKIFERFRQADLTISRKYEGAGLGLSISKAYVEMLGGKIWLESEKGIGTTFYFTIPDQQMKGTKKTAFEESGNVTQGSLPGNVNVLVAEDDPVSFALFEEIIDRKDIHFINAENGKIAIDILENNPNIDMILMDIKMPEMDGYEATRIIKEKYPGIPVVAQTAFASKLDKQKALDAGCDDYISKPIQEKEFILLLNRFLKDKK